jgi:basic membrane lipoprotein Med (substrate-binding protein (PBP1-ABC) superfamily)
MRYNFHPMVKHRTTILPAGILFAVLAGCSNGATSTAAATPTAESAPTATDTPEPFALLVAPAAPASGAPQSAIQAVETFAAQKGWELRRSAPGEFAVTAERLGSPALVVMIGSGEGQALTAAAQANPEVRFAAVEEPGVQPLANLLVVGGGNFRRDEAAFMAGLLAAIENDNDYIGWIGEDGTPRGAVYRNGFRHGVRYICPRCRVFDFELPAEASAAAGISAADQLREDFIDTASAVPGAAGEAGLIRLAGYNVRVAGAGTDFYAAVFGGGADPGAKHVLGEPAFRPEVLLADLLPRFLNGESFPDPIPYSLENGGLAYAPFPNEWVSPARQDYLRKILAEVASGRLGIGIDPQTGQEQ